MATCFAAAMAGGVAPDGVPVVGDGAAALEVEAVEEETIERASEEVELQAANISTISTRGTLAINVIKRPGSRPSYVWQRIAIRSGSLHS